MDLTVLVDDMLTERHQACLVCGAKPQWMESFVHWVPVLGVLCARCHHHHGWGVVERLLAQRSTGLQETTTHG